MPTVQRNPPVRASPKTPHHIVTPKVTATRFNVTPPLTTRTPVKTPAKRVANQSPSISPQKDSPINETTPGATTTDVVALDQNLNNPPRQVKFTKMSTEEVKRKLNGDEWIKDWEHPQILDELTPTPAEVLPYEFDEEDSTTIATL